MSYLLTHAIGPTDRLIPTVIDTDHIVFIQEHAFGCRVGLTNLPVALLIQEGFEYMLLLIRRTMEGHDAIESLGYGYDVETWLANRSTRLSTRIPEGDDR